MRETVVTRASGIALLFLLASAVPVLAESGDMTSAAQSAIEVLGRLGGIRASALEANTYTVYDVDQDRFTKNGDIGLVPKQYLVMLSGQMTKKVRGVRYVSDEFLSARLLDAINDVATESEAMGEGVSMETLEQEAGLAPGSLKRQRTSEWVSERGIMGRVRVDIQTGKPVEVMSFKKALPRLDSVAVSKSEAQALLAANGGTDHTAPVLVEPGVDLFFWCDASDTATPYINARTGELMTQNDMAALVLKIMNVETSIGPEAGGVTFSTMAPVFVEQGMHQDQHDPQLDGLCGPTSVSMIFDYFGQHISHLDIATVCEEQADAQTGRREIEHAGMFSHNSDGKFTYIYGDPPVQHDPVEGGYTERDCGYTACRGHAENNPWNSVVELVDERCPFVAHPAGHYLVVVGYAIDGQDRWIGVCDPSNTDQNWASYTWRAWDNFDLWWATVAYNYEFFVIRPMPVELEFLPDTPEAGLFTIRATVRTCQQFPAAEGQNAAWQYVNRQRELKGNSAGTEEDLPVTITYPGSVTMDEGYEETQYFDPDGVDDEGVLTWVFIENDNEKGGEFTVQVTGWANNYTSDKYTNPAQTDELFGWGVIRIDGSLLRVRNDEGDIVAAIGDQGNLYLAGPLDEWQNPDDVEPDLNTSELFTRNVAESNVGAIASSDGTLRIESPYHGGMDDVNDTCTTVVNGNDSEQDYLDNPSHATLMVKDAQGHVVAYISGGPTTLVDPSSAGSVNLGGDIRLKGTVFENWPISITGTKETMAWVRMVCATYWGYSRCVL